jgi:sugar phosphate isomerase/epimerase
MKITRRDFLGRSAALAAMLMARRRAFANPLGLPIGLQLYSVRQQIVQDLDATLAAVADAGYTEVEASVWPEKSAKEIRAALDKAGLRCVSSLRGFAELHTRFDELVSRDIELGVRFVICGDPGTRPAGTGSAPHTGRTLDDWHYNAEQFQIMGEAANRLGVRFGYHNHPEELKPVEGKVPLMELLRLTDPAKVTFELDCGWVVVGDAKPADTLRDYPHRFSMLHVKDFYFAKNPLKARGVRDTELGLGTIDYVPIFAQAAQTQRIEHAFVEQEGWDMPWKDSLKMDAAYLRKLV